MNRHQISSTSTQVGDLNPRRVFSVEDFLRWAGISRYLFYKLVKQGIIRPSKIGRRTVILPEEQDRFARELPRMGGVTGATAPENE